MQSDPTILIVDDDETQHYLTSRTLQRLGFEGDIAAVSDGTEAVRWLADHKGPLLVLLDLRMGLMDGQEVLEELAAGTLGDPPPVCIASSSSRPEDLDLPNCYDFVMAYVEKPPTPSVLWKVSEQQPEIQRHFTEPAST